MQAMMRTMESPDFRATMEKRLGDMKEDPEVSKIMADIETKGPSAMMKCALASRSSYYVNRVSLLACDGTPPESASSTCAHVQK